MRSQIDGKQKKAILLASVGNDTFKLIRNLFGQEDLKAETTTLENICKRVKDHLSPKPNYIFARSDFFDCARKPGQSIADFLVELRKLSEHYQFTNLNEMLRDKLVNGLKDVQTQRRFFEIKEDKLTLEKANLNVRSLNPEPTQPLDTVHPVDPEGEVLKFEKNTARRTIPPRSWNAADVVVRILLEIASGNIKNIEVEPSGTAEEVSCEGDCYTVFCTDEGPKTFAPYVVERLCQGKPIKMEVDTGASCTVMSRKEFDNLQKTTGNNIKLEPNRKPVRSYTKETIKETYTKETIPRTVYI
ncbi:uncharacterized protein [Montipora capricornis]|uniref:uncharacterized protein n=1 Tax=Montipora capricornis TaxID=246305 RepID=UPI0035F18CB4